MREDGAELRLVRRACSRLHLDQNRPHSLEPGRVIDLNEQAMLYFDPSLRLGLIRVTVTPLRGDDWSPGPVAEKRVTRLVTLQEVRMTLAHPGKGLGTCDL